MKLKHFVIPTNIYTHTHTHTHTQRILICLTSKTNCFNEQKKTHHDYLLPLDPSNYSETFEWNTSCNNQHSRPFPSSFGVHELLLETPLAKHLSQANPLTDSQPVLLLILLLFFNWD